MDDYHSFDGQIVPMPWGDAVYTVLPIPESVAEALAAQGAKRVEGEIAEHPVNLALTRAPVIDGVFVWTGKTLLDRIGIACGDWVEVRLRPADPNEVEVPSDVAAALSAAGLTAAWSDLRPGVRRRHLHSVETARRADTRARRIAALLAALRAD
ncbi:MAG: YdeI/OmpD-associated family protein [Pseudomonadota bacterium]